VKSRVEIRHLRAFVAVADARSFSAAARNLNVSQPALSQIVGMLEQSLGTRLLERGPCGVSPTSAGTALISEARILIRRFEKALAVVASFAPEASAALRIAVPAEMAAQPLADALSELAASPFRHTAVQISQLSCPAQLAALKEGALDLALIRERPVDEGLDVALLAEEPLGVLMAAEQAHNLDLGTADVLLEELASLKWMGFTRSDSPAWHDHVVAVLRNHGIKIGTETSEAAELPPAVKLAQLSMGGQFALVPRGCFPELPETLRWLPLVGEPLVRRTWTVWPSWSRRRDVALLIAAMEARCPRYKRRHDRDAHASDESPSTPVES
jgi:DNA-binding transcriptional LysR family regulator